MSHKELREICSACGTSPVNHKFLFILNFLDETLGKVATKVFYFISSDKWQKLADIVEKILFFIFSNIGLARFSKDIEKATTGRSKLIWEEAERRSIPMEQIVIFGKHIELYKAKINGQLIYFQSLPIPPWFPKNGQMWIDDKFTLFKKLKKEDIPVPATEKVFSLGRAKKSFDKMSKPVIIKPQNGSRSRHTTTSINTKDELEKAITLAREITLFTVMQEHLSGSVYRATVINNELVGFYRADAPFVKGDGLETVRELISEKNHTRNERLSEILINDDLNFFIKRYGYALDDILPKNKELYLSAKTGRMYGGYTKEMLPLVHPKMYSIFAKAGKLMEATVVGFDLIIKDPTKDPDTQRWGIIECNSLPFIDLHYFPLEGEPINLAKNVWDLWSSEKQK